jgi:hypothetical protein
MTKGIIPLLPPRVPVAGERYRHYKGDLYKVVGLAIHSNDDIWMVVYKPLYENADANFFTRPLDQWFEKVIYQGIEKTRFEKV